MRNLKSYLALALTLALDFSFAVILGIGSAALSSSEPAVAQSENQQRPLCAAEQITLNCVDHSKDGLDLRKNKSEADGVKFNYFLWGKREHHKELEKFASGSSEADQQRALGLVDTARKTAIQYVTGGRDPSDWSAETRTIVERIKLIEFRISEPFSPDCFEASDPGLPNAAYSAMEHTIGLCHSLVKTPSHLIMAVLLHEIGHAVSSCNMKKPLLRHKEMTEDVFRCLNANGSQFDDVLDYEYEALADQGDLTSADREFSMANRSLARTVGEIKLGVDVNATNTETLLRCGAVERVVNSNLPVVQGNLQFDQCAFKRFTKDYDRFVAASALKLDTMPKVLIKKEQNIVNSFKENNPQSCYRKSEEHYADAFAAAALAVWHKTENKKRSDFRLAVYDLAQTYCMGKLEERNVSNALLYPSDETRLLSYLVPQHFKDQIGCTDLIKPVCSVPEDPASLTSLSSSSRPNGKSQKRPSGAKGTVK